MTVQTETYSTGSSLVARFADLRANLADALAKRKVYRTTLSELQNLTDRDLADLGLSRSAIKGIAYEAAYRA